MGSNPTPGTSYSYNNIAMTAGGVAAARGAGTTFADAADRELFGPAGMTSSSFRYDDFLARENRTSLHIEVDGSHQPVYSRDADLLAPAAGASVNVKDMGTWMRIELAGGKLGEETIIEPDAFGWDGGPAAGGAQLPATFTVEGAVATTLSIGDPGSPAPWFVLTRTA